MREKAETDPPTQSALCADRRTLTLSPFFAVPLLQSPLTKMDFCRPDAEAIEAMPRRAMTARHDASFMVFVDE
jgi:hypothetical protein